MLLLVPRIGMPQWLGRLAYRTRHTNRAKMAVAGLEEEA